LALRAKPGKSRATAFNIDRRNQPEGVPSLDGLCHHKTTAFTLQKSQ